MDFSYEAAFKLIAQGGDHITPQLMKEYFAQKGYYASDRDIHGLFVRFASYREHKIDQEQFRRALTR